MAGMGLDLGTGCGGGGNTLYGPLSFRDENTTARAAGAVHGTACEPGSGNRELVDTETCISIIPNLSAAVATHAGVTFGGNNNRCSYATGYGWMDYPTGFNAALQAGLGRIVVMYDGSRGCYVFLGAAGDGETLDTEIATGTLVKGKLYVITVTESNHFGTGYIVGRYFVSLGTETCDANNKVQQVLNPSATGCWVYPTLAKALAGDTAQSGWNKPAAFNMNSAAYIFGIHDPLSGGKKFYMGGKAAPSPGDPGDWRSAAITRAAGVLGAYKITPVDASAITNTGFDETKSSTLSGSGCRIGEDTIKLSDTATAGPIVANITDNTENTILIVLRAAGAHLFRKLSTGNWKYLYSSSTNNTATLYLGTSGYSQAFYQDWVRSPFLKWMHTPIVSDSFSGANGTNNGRLSDGLGHAEGVAGGIGSGGSGIAWSGASGSIVSERLVITPSLGSELVVNGGFDSDYTGWTSYNAIITQGTYGGVAGVVSIADAGLYSSLT